MVGVWVVVCQVWSRDVRRVCDDDCLYKLAEGGSEQLLRGQGGYSVVSVCSLFGCIMGGGSV